MKQSWMCKRVGNITEVPKCDVGAQAVGGWVVLQQPRSFVWEHCLLPAGPGGLQPLPGVTRWSPALSARVPWKAKAVWAGCSPLCCAGMGFLQKMLWGWGWTESHQCIQDVGSVELIKDVRSALLGQSGIAEFSLCFFSIQECPWQHRREARGNSPMAGGIPPWLRVFPLLQAWALLSLSKGPSARSSAGL